MIVAYLRPCAGYDAEDGAFSDVRIADQPDVGDRLQFKPQRPDFRFDTGPGKVGGLPCRRSEMLVAPSAFSAFQQQSGFTRLIHVRHDPVAGVIKNDGAYRDFDRQVVSAPACAVV